MRLVPSPLVSTLAILNLIQGVFLCDFRIGDHGHWHWNKPLSHSLMFRFYSNMTYTHPGLGYSHQQKYFSLPYFSVCVPLMT